MYSVGSIPLDNPAFGWKLRSTSKPLSELATPRTTLRTPGRPGVVAGVPADLDVVQLSFVVETPRANLEALLALWTYGAVLSLTATPDRTAIYEMLALAPEGFGDADALVDVQATVRLPGVFWRDVVESTSAAVTIGSASVFVSAWEGQSGITPDAIVRVRGPVGGLQVRSGESWFSYPDAIPSGSYVRFHAETSEAFLTTSNVWTGGTDVSGLIEVDGPGGSFAVVPAFTDPTDRTGCIEVTTTSRAAGATAELRGRGAYLVV